MAGLIHTHTHLYTPPSSSTIHHPDVLADIIHTLSFPTDML